ncbi:MAG: excinuclease ABC subunit UvrC [Clostridia bacterium]
MLDEQKLKTLREKAMKLPLTPGVYIMKNKSHKIIYIGKAKKLKNRVSQYFGSQNNHLIKVRKMVENVDDFDYILTDTEFEALVLECSLIKQYMPKYNILLKDDKGYSYVKITANPWGKLSPCYRKDDPDANYIGPYTGNFSVSNAVSQAKEIFKLPTCNKVFPRDIKKSRPCLNFYIDKCAAPCSGKIKRSEYEENLAGAVAFLKGGSTNYCKKLQEEMMILAENLEFEKAGKLRDRIKAIEKINNKQKIIIAQGKDEDVFAIVQSEDKACLAVLNFRDGVLYASEHFIIDSSENLSDTRHELLMSYYSLDRQIPSEIIVDDEVSDSELIEQWLSEKKCKKVSLTVPQRGEKVKLMQMCSSNAAQKLAELMDKKAKDTAVLDELAKMLNLNKTPEYIESYDISHTGGSDNVGALIVFKNGKPFKSAYKRFAIKGFAGQDDYGSMREVFSRRLNRYEEEKDSGMGFGKLPDLILLDGGKGQVNAVLPIIEAFGLDIPVFGMVKDSKHKTRAITSSGGEIAINSTRSVFSLVSNIQDEVHRFAITYHKSKHSKNAFSSTLTQIEGIGKKKAENLIKHFKTMAKIKSASVEELGQAYGIGEKDAINIYSHFHEKSKNIDE